MEKMEKDILEERIIKGATDHGVSHSRMGGCDRPIYIYIYIYINILSHPFNAGDERCAIAHAQQHSPRTLKGTKPRAPS